MPLRPGCARGQGSRRSLCRCQPAAHRKPARPVLLFSLFSLMISPIASSRSLSGLLSSAVLDLLQAVPGLGPTSEGAAPNQPAPAGRQAALYVPSFHVLGFHTSLANNRRAGSIIRLSSFLPWPMVRGVHLNASGSDRPLRARSSPAPASEPPADSVTS